MKAALSQTQIDRLRNNAQKAVLAAASATKAKAHVALAQISAEHGSLPQYVVDDLANAMRYLERAIKNAETFRIRKLRKADRREHAHD